MNTNLFALEILASIGIGLWLFYGPWRLLVIEMSRQGLFELRDEIFDLGAEGKIQFSSAEYLKIRDTFNSMIRLNHLFGLGILLWLPNKPKDAKGMEDWLNEMNESSVANILRAKYHQAVVVMVTSLIFRSLPLLFLTALFMPVLLGIILFRGTSANRKLVDKLRILAEREIPITYAA